ncbi:MAG: VTT domain-containing protein, partial [Rhodobacteraceae bacterium]|nr:VTT domain-containing protein [Paracoccaceae bacterium]
MADQGRTSGLGRLLPIAIIVAVAGVGALTLGDQLSFETLRENREALLAWRDSHFASAVLVFMAAYVVIVAFSLPGATVATLTGGFLFGVFPGAFFNIVAATIGATAIFLAARWGLGERLATRMDASEGRVKRIKAALDENQWSVLFLIRLVPVVPFFVA